jgi:hypothetical protein
VGVQVSQSNPPDPLWCKKFRNGSCPNGTNGRFIHSVNTSKLSDIPALGKESDIRTILAQLKVAQLKDQELKDAGAVYL